MSPTLPTTSAIPTPPASTPAPPRPQSQPGASQFSQFRLTTFVDSNPKPIPIPKPKSAANGLASGSASAAQSPIPRPQSVPVGATKGSNTAATPTSNGKGTGAPKGKENEAGAATAHRRTASAAATKIPNNQHNGFGVLDLTPPLPPAGQGKLGQHRDGRVRNPVPRKLKGKTDMRNGNFSVMHMDMSGVSVGGEKVGATDRGKEAQRTSENTAKAAREALRDKQAGSGSIKRRRVDGEGQWEPILSQASRVEVRIVGGRPSQSFMPVVKKEIVHRTGDMTGEEVKYEQARLLTLLRSLNPLAVVDQMCTALAFFGGIPGAPPPGENGSFPESEDANGNGALFVGWLSEIFPDVSRRAWSNMKVPEREASVVQGKRPRGRPKGSKASKVRKDKGTKKGRKDGLPSNASQPGGADDGDDPADDDWVDIGIGDNEAGPSGGNAHAEGGMILDLDTVDTIPSQPPGKRKIGRPRGSQTKGKEREADSNDVPSPEIYTLSSPSQQNQVKGNTSSAFAQQSPSQALKRKSGRPPGSKTKPKEGAPPPNPKPAKAPKPAKEGPIPTRARSLVDGSIPAGLSADERAVLEAYRKNKALAGPEKTEDPVKKKRKSRAKPKPAQDAAGAEAGEQNGQEDTPTIFAQQLNSAPVQRAAAPQPTMTPVPPPPKRQRKGKETASISAPSKPTNINSAIDPSLQSAGPMSASPHLLSTKNQPQPQQSQQQRAAQQPARSLSASNAHANNNPFASPPMNGMNNGMANSMMSIDSIMPSATSQQRTSQGLEAHYERFASAANQDSSGSPDTYSMTGMAGHGQTQAQRGSPAVGQGMAMQRANSQQHQQRSQMTRSPQKSLSGLGSNADMSNTNNGLYYGQSQPQQQQPQRHISHNPAQTYGYTSGSGMVQNQQASRSSPYNMDFGTRPPSLGSNMNQLPSSSGTQQRGGGGGYGVQGQHQQQQQNQGYFDGGNVTGGYVDLPALEGGMGGTQYGGMAAGGMAQGAGLAGARGGSYGAGMGGGLFGTEQSGGVGLTESEMRERLLRGIGRR